MPEANGDKLHETVLHNWHVENGAKMVEFGGWDMPVQYASGIIQEHLATRRDAGLFDVSHMGRFRVRGREAENFLLKALTNNARALDPGHAQYTFISNEAGGAVDDAYLYCLDTEDFLLVVNAGNRPKDWEWLEGLKGNDVDLTDESEAFSMISLQGPNASHVLEEVIDADGLPENKRNHLSTAVFDGEEVIVARTGYTGETVCFELFPPYDLSAQFWQALIDKGAHPVGLGARDSLRLEAGLPLYGHELGEDLKGDEIPIFANSLAKFAVRAAGGEDYVGRPALERQRTELIDILRGELDTPVNERTLSSLIQPIAVFGERKPLRAGFKVHLDGCHVGYVTSGTSVPFSQFYGLGITAVPSDEHEMRPIGLAVINSDIRYRADRP
ncbi:MAG: glycine cleavage system aminomethyltransferase GcvT, partial [Rhodospirillales bacterium]